MSLLPDYRSNVTSYRNLLLPCFHQRGRLYPWTVSPNKPFPLWVASVKFFFAAMRRWLIYLSSFHVLLSIQRVILAKAAILGHTAALRLPCWHSNFPAHSKQIEDRNIYLLDINNLSLMKKQASSWWMELYIMVPFAIKLINCVTTLEVGRLVTNLGNGFCKPKTK